MKKIIFCISVFIISSFTTFAQRKVLVEQFTNSGCPPCAANTPVVAAFINANIRDYLMLAYHTSFPYFDSMYFENSFQSDQRVAFYGIPAVPNSVVDGNFFSGNLLPTLQSTTTDAAAIPPRYNITFTSGSLNGNVINASVLFESTDALNNGESLKAMIVLAEKNVLKSSYLCCAGANTETEYPWVVRRMLPDENGTTLLNTNFNGTDLVNISWNTTNIKNYNELRIVAFVQNTITKAIYQSEILTPSITTGISENISSDKNLFSILNSSSDNISLHFNPSSENYTIHLFNVMGQTLYQEEIKNVTDRIINTSRLNSGIYFVRVGNGINSETKRVVLNR